MINVASDERYIQMRNDHFKYLQEIYKLNKLDTHISPSNKYKLEIEYFNYKEGYYSYSCTLGTLTNLETNESIEIRRNMSHFLFEWITKDNMEYLICGQDYQGYSIVDLGSLKLFDFVPEEVYEGLGFCWASVEHEGENLIVEGCIWAHRYERIIYDFSNPLKLPYPELHRTFIDEE